MLSGAEPPAATRLPVEPTRPYPAGTVEDVRRGATSSAAVPVMSSSDFDVAFVTPPMVQRAQQRSGWTGGQSRPFTRGPGSPWPAHRVWRLVRVFQHSAGGADRPRNPEDGGRILEAAGTRGGGHARRRPAAIQGLQDQLPAHARDVRRCRGHTHPPLRARAPRDGEEHHPRGLVRVRSRRIRSPVRDGDSVPLFRGAAGTSRYAHAHSYHHRHRSGTTSRHIARPAARAGSDARPDSPFEVGNEFSTPPILTKRGASRSWRHHELGTGNRNEEPAERSTSETSKQQ